MGKKRTKGKNQRRALRDRLMRQALDKETIKGNQKLSLKIRAKWDAHQATNRASVGKICFDLTPMITELS
jgi:hypothetical protein